MPIPTPRTNEGKQDYLNRCMGDDTMRQDFESTGQRYAVCNSKWEEHARRRKPDDKRQDDKTRR